MPLPFFLAPLSEKHVTEGQQLSLIFPAFFELVQELVVNLLYSSSIGISHFGLIGQKIYTYFVLGQFWGGGAEFSVTQPLSQTDPLIITSPLIVRVVISWETSDKK